MNRFTPIVLACFLAFTPQKPIVCPLEKWFQTYNDTYFDGKLVVSSVAFAEMPLSTMGMTTCEVVGTKICWIRISKHYQDTPPVYLETILHEACHVQIMQSIQGDELESHGPRFQACMLRLAEAGALKGLW